MTEEKEKNIISEEESTVSEEDRFKARKAGCILFAFVLFIFAVILFAADYIERYFGKLPSTILLCIAAAAVAVYLFKDKIAAFFKRIFRK